MHWLDTNLESLATRASRGEPVASVELRCRLETRLRPVVRRALRVRDDTELTQRILAAAQRRTGGKLHPEADHQPGLIAQVACDLAALLALGLHRRRDPLQRLAGLAYA
jgi:hypothetical protein